jgi:hypothetical protein
MSDTMRLPSEIGGGPRVDVDLRYMRRWIPQTEAALIDEVMQLEPTDEAEGDE